MFLTTTFATNDVDATAMTPTKAVRRPRSPPATAKSAAPANEIREWFAADDSQLTLASHHGGPERVSSV